MAELDSGPCEAWEPIGCGDWPDELSAIRDDALMAATEVLWNRTMRRFGLCEITLRPCRRECDGFGNLALLYGSWLPTWGGGGGGWGWPFPALLGGRWYNLGCGMCGDNCSCTTLHQIELPTPVADILEIKIDGDTLDPTTYRVDDWRWLVRLGGQDWPLCQDLNLADTEDGTWSIRATYGEATPTLGLMAVNELALQFAQACVGGPCALPGGVVKAISRQGVTREFLVHTENMSLLGLPLSDRFINTYNPTNAGVATVYNIDA